MGPLVSERHLGVAVTSTGTIAEADAAYIDAGQTLREAGHLMRELGVGTLVVRAENGEVRLLAIFCGSLSGSNSLRALQPIGARH